MKLINSKYMTQEIYAQKDANTSLLSTIQTYIEDSNQSTQTFVEEKQLKMKEDILNGVKKMKEKDLDKEKELITKVIKNTFQSSFKEEVHLFSYLYLC